MNLDETADGQVQEWRSYEKRRAVCPCENPGRDCFCEDDGAAALERAESVSRNDRRPGDESGASEGWSRLVTASVSLNATARPARGQA